MSTPIPQVANTNILRDAEFVNIAITFANGTDKIIRNFYFSTSFKQETIGGQIYTDLGGLTSISAYQRDISSSGYDTTISISGLDEMYIYIVSGGPASAPIPVTNQDPIPIGYYPIIKGSIIKILRGFYNENYVLTDTVLRYTGLITSYAIAEERDNSFDALNNTYTINLQCSAYRQILENKLTGRKTNTQSWKYWYPNDTSMDRVSELESKQFDFGKDVK